MTRLQTLKRGRIGVIVIQLILITFANALAHKEIEAISGVANMQIDFAGKKNEHCILNLSPSYVQ